MSNRAARENEEPEVLVPAVVDEEPEIDVAAVVVDDPDPQINVAPVVEVGGPARAAAETQANDPRNSSEDPESNAAPMVGVGFAALAAEYNRQKALSARRKKWNKIGCGFLATVFCLLWGIPYALYLYNKYRCDESHGDLCNGRVVAPNKSLSLSVSKTLGSYYLEADPPAVHIDLSSNRLVGTLPTTIGLFSQLTYLDLCHNDISGQIPSEIGLLTGLKHLALGGNDLSGQIPSEIGLMTELTHLELGLNHLFGSLPSQLGRLTLLSSLVLWANHLQGNVTEVWNWEDMTKLSYLDLSLNPLTGQVHLPPSLTSLDTFYAENSLLTGSIHPDLCRNNASQVLFVVECPAFGCSCCRQGNHGEEVPEHMCDGNSLPPVPSAVQNNLNP